MDALYTAAQCRDLDRLAIERHGIPGHVLMERAGRAAFRALLERWPEARSLSICCGRGNNAGDGYVVAGLARRLGLDVQVLQVGDAGELTGDAARARDQALAEGVEPVAASAALRGDVIVDALLGTGFRGELRPPFAELVARINAARLQYDSAPDGRHGVLAIDIPTGVEADTGAVRGSAVHADLTVTFIGRKIGLYTGAGVACRGELRYADLGVPSQLFRAIAGCPLLDFHEVAAAALPRRDANAYKQALGHVVVAGGDHSMGGATLMAAEAALRVGAGMVSVITRAGHRPAILARRPEIMVVDADDLAQRAAVFGRASCLVAGPGIGRAPWGRELLQQALALQLPTVLDADGLWWAAELNLPPAGRGGDLVITPHAAEAARLLGITTAEVAHDRPQCALRLVERSGGIAVLKGAGSLIAGPAPAAGTRGGATAVTPALLGVCGHGNPGMATAGMGDVLSGVIGGLLAQGLTATDAALLGVCLHSCAADKAVRRLGELSLLATDLLPEIIELLAAAQLGAAPRGNAAP
ncbi:MAG: NAD(P)H-hydrate dehydratase [Pseudomonadales bacterium]